MLAGDWAGGKGGRSFAVIMDDALPRIKSFFQGNHLRHG